jgi:hypothetical protein
MGRTRSTHVRFWWESQKEKVVDVCARIILKWILEKRPVDGSCEQGNKPSGSIKCLEILEYLSDWRLLKKD